MAELVKQLDAGVLPAATENGYYAVYFPAGMHPRGTVRGPLVHGVLGVPW